MNLKKMITIGLTAASMVMWVGNLRANTEIKVTYKVPQPQLKSPNGKSVINLRLKNGQPNWSVAFGDKQIIKPSALGLQTESNLGKEGFKVIGCTGLESDETRKTVWGKHAEIRNHYRELTWQLQEKGAKQRRLDVIVRAYDDGVAVRYKIHGTGSETVSADLTTFDFTGDYTCWSARGGSAIGPGFRP